VLLLPEVSLVEEPFYRRWWFLVIVALVGIILVLITIGILYVTGKKHRRRNAKSASVTLTANLCVLSFI